MRARPKKRKSLSKTVRFEVFKRDGFQCQYCGQKAPDVVLETDHIKPVSKGGENEIINLITSCRDCNAGKGARELHDRSVVEKQRHQLEELNERRLQLEMLLEWREELAKIEEQRLQAVVDAVIKRDSHYSLNETGLRKIRKWLKRYPLEEILDALDVSFNQYLEWDNDNISTVESWNKAFDFIPRIINVKRRSKDKPYLSELFYIRGILRNRLNYVNEHECMRLLEHAVRAGASIESLREFAKSCRSWTAFREEIQDFLDEYGEPE